MLPLLLLMAAPPAIPSWFKGTVLIARKGEIVLHRGYGFDADAPFWVASISKQFTAAAIITLRDRGKLSLSDPISKFVGEVPEDKRGITISHLLTHTAGLANNYAADGIDDRKKAIAALLSHPLKHPPGGAFGYTNDAYNLLAIIVEIASGQRFEEFVKREIFDPARLEHTGFWRGRGHDRVAPILGEHPAQKAGPSYGFRGATGIYSTTGDLHRWYRALSANPKLAGELWAPKVEISDGRAGYGWFMTPSPRKTESVWTRGTEDMGHNAILMTFPKEELVIVAASNGGERDGIAASRKLAEDLAKELLAAPPVTAR